MYDDRAVFFFAHKTDSTAPLSNHNWRAESSAPSLSRAEWIGEIEIVGTQVYAYICKYRMFAEKVLADGTHVGPPFVSWTGLYRTNVKWMWSRERETASARKDISTHTFCGYLWYPICIRVILYVYNWSNDWVLQLSWTISKDRHKSICGRRLRIAFRGNLWDPLSILVILSSTTRLFIGYAS